MTTYKTQNIYIYSDENISVTNVVSIISNISGHPTIINCDAFCVLGKTLQAIIDDTNKEHDKR